MKSGQAILGAVQRPPRVKFCLLLHLTPLVTGKLYPAFRGYHLSCDLSIYHMNDVAHVLWMEKTTPRAAEHRGSVGEEYLVFILPRLYTLL